MFVIYCFGIVLKYTYAETFFYTYDIILLASCPAPPHKILAVVIHKIVVPFPKP